MNFLARLSFKLPWLHRVAITNGRAFELTKGKSYVIVFDRTFITLEECQILSKVLKNKGMANVTCVLGYGDPNQNMEVIEDDTI